VQDARFVFLHLVYSVVRQRLITKDRYWVRTWVSQPIKDTQEWTQLWCLDWWMLMIYASMHSLITALLSHHMKPIGRLLHVPDRRVWRVEPPCYVESGGLSSHHWSWIYGVLMGKMAITVLQMGLQSPNISTLYPIQQCCKIDYTKIKKRRVQYSLNNTPAWSRSYSVLLTWELRSYHAFRSRETLTLTPSSANFVWSGWRLITLVEKGASIRTICLEPNSIRDQRVHQSRFI
jgi:hypothetical protein